jgi:hypothetical protein
MRHSNAELSLEELQRLLVAEGQCPPHGGTMFCTTTASGVTRYATRVPLARTVHLSPTGEAARPSKKTTTSNAGLSARALKTLRAAWL